MAHTDLEQRVEPRNFLKRNWGKLTIAGVTLITAAGIFFSINPAKQEQLLDMDHNGRISISELVKWGGYHPGEAFGQYIKGLFGFSIDIDRDKLIDFDEVHTYKTAINKGDTDGDGLNDGLEIKFGSSPYMPDTDFDKLNDYEEFRAGTNPHASDSDRDGLIDYDEVKVYHSNPNKADSDGDGLTDAEEVRLGTPINNADIDGDKLTDSEEIRYGSNPRVKDTDGDGLNDYEEVKTYGTSPSRRDTDGDGLDDKVEITYGSSPIKADTDGDGLNDQYEKLLGTRFDSADSDRDQKSDYQEATQKVIEWQVGSAWTRSIEMSNTSGTLTSVFLWNNHTARQNMMLWVDSSLILNYIPSTTNWTQSIPTNIPLGPGRHTVSVTGLKQNPFMYLTYYITTTPSSEPVKTQEGWRISLPSG